MGLKAHLIKMADSEGQFWTRALPWTLLGKRTQYQPDIDASPAELVYGQPLKVPGDLAGADLEHEESVQQLLQKLHINAAKAPNQTSHHTTNRVYMPEEVQNCTHVMVKCGKTTPLGANFDGPYPIQERRGTSCALVKMGTYTNGQPRLQLHHWNNMKPAHFAEEPYEVSRPKLGRPSKQ